MFKHDVFSPFHRLKPEEIEDFEKHYFDKLVMFSIGKTCMIITIPSKHDTVIANMMICWCEVLLFEKAGR